MRIHVFSAAEPGLEPRLHDAREAVFQEFVATLRRMYPHLWPSKVTAGVRSTSRPWPACWQQHPGLVADLRHLQGWAAALAAGEVKGDAYSAWDSWRRYVETVLVDNLRTISSRTCLHGHVHDSGEPAALPERETPSAPPLPWQPRPTSAPPAPVPTGWRDGFEQGARDID